MGVVAGPVQLAGLEPPAARRAIAAEVAEVLDALEVDVPVLKDLPLARELSFNVAGRYSKYDTFAIPPMASSA